MTSDEVLLGKDWKISTGLAFSPESGIGTTFQVNTTEIEIEINTEIKPEGLVENKNNMLGC